VNIIFYDDFTPKIIQIKYWFIKALWSAVTENTHPRFYGQNKYLAATR